MRGAVPDDRQRVREPEEADRIMWQGYPGGAWPDSLTVDHSGSGA